MEDLNVLGDLIEIVCQGLLVYFVVKLILNFMNFHSNMKETSKQIQDYLHSIVHPIKSEKHGDVIYFFDEETDAFIVQGRNDQEIRDALRARWEDHIFLVGQKYVMAGPEFKMVEITDPEDIGKMLAEKVINR
jgi:hypothetical protein